MRTDRAAEQILKMHAPDGKPVVMWGEKVEYGPYTGTPGWVWYQRGDVSVGGKYIGWMEALRRGKQMQKSTHAPDGQFVVGHDVPWLLMLAGLGPRRARESGRSYRPELLKRLAAPPRKSEGEIDYSVSGDLDHQFTAPGSYAGDFGGGGGTQHATRVRYVAGQTDQASGEYSRVRVDQVGRWENDQPMGLSAQAHMRIKRAARLAIKKQTRRAAVKVAGTKPEPAGRPDPEGFIPPGVPEPAAVEFLPVQPWGGYGIAYGKVRHGGRASGMMKADVRWEGMPDRKVPVTNEGAAFDPIGDILKEADDCGY